MTNGIWEFELLIYMLYFQHIIISFDYGFKDTKSKTIIQYLAYEMLKGALVGLLRAFSDKRKKENKHL